LGSQSLGNVDLNGIKPTRNGLVNSVQEKRSRGKDPGDRVRLQGQAEGETAPGQNSPRNSLKTSELESKKKPERTGQLWFKNGVRGKECGQLKFTLKRQKRGSPVEKEPHPYNHKQLNGQSGTNRGGAGGVLRTRGDWRPNQEKKCESARGPIQ